MWPHPEHLRSHTGIILRDCLYVHFPPGPHLYLGKPGMERRDGARPGGKDFSARKVEGLRANLGLPVAPLLCPYCTKTYSQNQELSLWIHAKDHHRESLGAIFSTPADEVRRREQFLRIASEDR